jgi:hypothetical protein
MRAILALSLALVCSQSAHASFVFSPPRDPSDLVDPSMILIFDIIPEPTNLQAGVSGADRRDVFDSTIQIDRSTQLASFGMLWLYMRGPAQANPFRLLLREEAANTSIGTYNIAIVPGATTFARNVTVTAPGYSRSFVASFVPEPSAILLALPALAFIRRRR